MILFTNMIVYFVEEEKKLIDWRDCWKSS